MCRWWGLQGLLLLVLQLPPMDPLMLPQQLLVVTQELQELLVPGQLRDLLVLLPPLQDLLVPPEQRRDRLVLRELLQDLLLLQGQLRDLLLPQQQQEQQQVLLDLPLLQERPPPLDLVLERWVQSGNMETKPG